MARSFGGYLPLNELGYRSLNGHRNRPWGTLGVIFLAVYLVALLTTFIPALRASRIYPAQALRYQ
jgi:hypothetical protein